MEKLGQVLLLYSQTKAGHNNMWPAAGMSVFCSRPLLDNNGVIGQYGHI